MNKNLIVLLALGCTVTSKSKDDDDDAGRPYEFGFTIDGQQHRHESKDINGIIMGEFGFITADGVYHVTVYATDENGSFKILSMKNIKISEPLDQPGVRLPAKLPSGGNPSPIKQITTTTTTPKTPYRFTTVPSLNVPSCSSCALPSTTPRAPGSSNKLPFQTPQFQPGYKPPKPNGQKPNYPLTDGGSRPSFPVASTGGGSKPNYPNGATGSRPSFPVASTDGGARPSFPAGSTGGGVNKPSFPVASTGVYPGNKPGINKPALETQPPYKNPSQNTIPSPNYPLKPVRAPIDLPPKVQVSNGMIMVPGKAPIPIKDKYPNMQDGLPAGITQDDMLDLLYKFNYTVGFHGHHEKGLKNGAKIGGYFVNGRDGISRVVEYIADENGYRPKVKFINLGLDSPYTPKEGTEKTFGLQGFEFVWYPV